MVIVVERVIDRFEFGRFLSRNSGRNNEYIVVVRGGVSGEVMSGNIGLANIENSVVITQGEKGKEEYTGVRLAGYDRVLVGSWDDIRQVDSVLCDIGSSIKCSVGVKGMLYTSTMVGKEILKVMGVYELGRYLSYCRELGYRYDGELKKLSLWDKWKVRKLKRRLGIGSNVFKTDFKGLFRKKC